MFQTKFVWLKKKSWIKQATGRKFDSLCQQKIWSHSDSQRDFVLKYFVGQNEKSCCVWLNTDRHYLKCAVFDVVHREQL